MAHNDNCVGNELVKSDFARGRDANRDEPNFRQLSLYKVDCFMTSSTSWKGYIRINNVWFSILDQKL
jgi:hypothetical protein